MKEWKSIEKDGKPKKSGQYLVSVKVFGRPQVDIMDFTTDPYKLDKYDFFKYKNKKTEGIFYSYDSEWGYSDWPDEDVTAWMEMIDPYED